MLLALFLLVIVLLFLFLAAGPLESLGWWSSEGAEDVSRTVSRLTEQHQRTGEKPPYERYVIYLSGIGAIGGDSVPPEELPLIEGIRELLPKCCVINDVFPYAVDNRGLTAQRPLTKLWHRVEKARFKNPETIAGMLVNARNAIQLFVCADRRYGPTYNIGTAQQMLEALLRNGYRLGSGVPVTVIGWSGGGQIALGACWYLAEAKIPINVISLGGMLSDDIGLDRIEHLWHLKGTNDPLQRLGEILFAGRWPSAVNTPWTRAMKEDRITIITLGPMHHNVTAHYFDPTTIAPDGRSYLQVSIDAIVAILSDQPVRTVPVDDDDGKKKGGRKKGIEKPDGEVAA